MDFTKELASIYDKSVGGTVILEDGNRKVVYVEGTFEKDKDSLIGEFGDDVFSWFLDCPELETPGELEVWEKIDSEAGKYYRIESSLFEKEGKRYQLHKLQDITEYMKLNQDITKYISFFKKLAKFQAAVLEKLSHSYYDLLPMLSDYYATNKVYFMIQREENLDITTYTRVEKQFSNDRVEMGPLSGKVFRNKKQTVLTMQDFDESVSNVFRTSGSKEDAEFLCLCQGEVSDQKYALYIGVWPNMDLKSAKENVVINVIKLYLENGIMRERLIYDKEHDSLTGLYNKGKYLEMIENVYPNLSSIAYFNFDVNNLKKINDTMGHEAGDRLIIKAADSIRKVTNNDVHGFRMGGDEFLLVACNVGEADADKIKLRWEEELARLNTLEDDIECVIAAGIVWAEKPYDLTEISKKADELMYEDKKKKKKPGEEIR